ncbi:SpoVR like protein [compost metagenome]
MAYLSTGSEWTFELVNRYDREIARIAGEFGLDTYPNQIEIITAEQMLDAYASAGLPVGYNHWSYGKHFLASERSYQRGHMGLAYEIVINSNPCIAYLMEENTMPIQADRENYLQMQVNDLWRTLPKHRPHALTADDEMPEMAFPPEPQENLLYFIEKNAPKLAPWQREIVRIVRKIAQYFYPQRQTKVMNEGWATFWHYTILHQLYEEKLVNDAFMIELLQAHTNVIYQPPYHSPYYSGMNPYTVGFLIFQDLRRMCENPTDEDYRWAPEIAGSDWRTTLDFAMRNFKDESFLLQFLSPRVIRELKLFSVLDDDREGKLRVTAIHDDEGYRAIRQLMAAQYDLSTMEPNIQVTNVDIGGDRSLTLRHLQNDRRPLAHNFDEVVRHVTRLWGFTVRLEVAYEDGRTELKYECKPERRHRKPHGGLSLAA